MRTISRREWAFLAFILVFSFVPTFAGLLRVLELSGGPAIVPENPRALSAPLPIVLHILSSFVFCIFGAMQFLPTLRRHHPSAHRSAGRVIAVSGALSAATGLWMTVFFSFPESLQGETLYRVRLVLGIAMLALIVLGVLAARVRNIPTHRAAMIRAYAIGQGASTQAFLGMFWMIIVGTELQGTLRDGVMILAWVLNLLAAETVIRTHPSSRSPSRRQARHARALGHS